MPYSTVRDLLFQLPPEVSHHFALNGLCWGEKLNCFSTPANFGSPLSVMGLEFPNKIGLAAGLDKNGDYIRGLAALGFGHIEIGTITPKPQPGNPKPRLFRLPEAEALINRMGFNNKGVDYLLEQVTKSSYKGILGINIGKNFFTPLDKAVDDYLYCLERVYPHASYITINISSPNTPGLRELQMGVYLKELLFSLKKAQRELATKHQKTVPLAVKIAPDLNGNELAEMCRVFLEQKIDGIIATNTTLSREGVTGLAVSNENGGLSGKPLFRKSLSIVQELKELVKDCIPIIACGGIMSCEDAQLFLESGASLIQVYTGFIYRGPGLIKQLSQL